MTVEEKKTIDMIRQIREAVESESLPLEQFPVEDLTNLIRATMGREFLGIAGGMQKEKFGLLINSFLEMLHHCMEYKDVQGCTKILALLQEQYVCFDAILNAVNDQRFVDKYKKVSIAAGEAYSSLQYFLHQNRRNLDRETSGIGATGKGVVYTCTFFSKEGVQQPEYINWNWDYICFTNEKEKWGTKDGIWEYRGIDVENIQDVRTLLYICMIKPYLLLPEYDYSIWVYPNYKIVGDLELFLDSYGRTSSFLAFPAYTTDDMYDIMITGLSSDDENIRMRKKYLQYEKEGYPTHFGMISTRVMVRNHRDDTMCKVMETWWDEAVQCGRLWNYGFNYAAWRNNFDYAICDLFIEMNSYFKNVIIDLEVKTNE